MEDSRQRPSCGSLHTGVALACSSITSSPEKQPLNQPFTSFMQLLGPNLGPSNQNEHGEPFKRSGFSSYEQRLVISWGSLYHQQPEVIHSKIHLWKVSAVCVSCHRQNKNFGNHSRSQSDLFLLISSHHGLQRWVLYIVFPPPAPVMCWLGKGLFLAHFTPDMGFSTSLKSGLSFCAIHYPWFRLRTGIFTETGRASVLSFLFFMETSVKRSNQTLQNVEIAQGGKFWNCILQKCHFHLAQWVRKKFKYKVSSWFHGLNLCTSEIMTQC